MHLPSGPQKMAFASALSTAASTERAVEAVTHQLAESIGRDPVDLLVGFATPEHGDRFDLLQRQLRCALGPQVLMLTSAAGVLGGEAATDTGPGLSVLAARLPGATLEPVSWEQKDWPTVLGAEAAPHSPEKVDEQEAARAVLLVADRETSPWLDLLPALEAAYPGVPIVGGGVTGGDEPEGVRLLVNDQLQDAGAVGVVIRGAVDVQCLASQGCRPIGEPWVITDADAERIWGLGGRHPVSVMESLAETLPVAEQRLIDTNGLYLGRVINEYKPRFGRGDFLVREVLDIDEQQGSLLVNDPLMAVGQTVQFHVLDPKCVEADLGLLLEAQRLYEPPQGLLMFTSAQRWAARGQRVERDPHLVQRALGPTPLAGFMADGQLGPGNRGNHAHVRAASLMVFRQPAETPSPTQEPAV
jgi:small ligand-binding sensory domain FIST